MGQRFDSAQERHIFLDVIEFVLFILLDSISNVLDKHGYNCNVEHFYTTQEIKHYSNSKYDVKKIKFPLIFKMIQVEDDQWIGKITVDMLMQLRKAQLINYTKDKFSA